MVLPKDITTNLSLAPDRVAYFFGGVSRSNDDPNAFLCQCPFDTIKPDAPIQKSSSHELHISKDENGNLVLCCSAGCSEESMIEILKECWLYPHTGEVVSSHQYVDMSGKPAYIVQQLSTGIFRLKHPIPWEDRFSGLNDCFHLYNWPKVLESISSDGRIIITSNEADADIVNSYGLVATTKFGRGREFSCPEIEGMETAQFIVIKAGGEEDHYANKVCNYLKSKGLWYSILELSNAKTIASWELAGGTQAEFLKLVDQASQRWKVEKHGDYEVSALGLFHVGTNKNGVTQRTRIAAPLWVKSKIRDRYNNNWGLSVEFADPDGQLHTCTFAKVELNNSTFINLLLSRGFQFAPTRSFKEHLILYLASAVPTATARNVSSLGWHESSFVLPNRTIGESAEPIIFQAEGKPPQEFETKGTLDQWREHVGSKCKGNSRLLFAVSLSLAAPLLKIMNEESGGVHLKGKSSEGKTTCQCTGASVWYNPNKLPTWAATVNGLEGICKNHCDMPLILDELSRIAPKDSGQATYLIGSGKGKQRSTREGDARGIASWRTLLLSSGEVSLDQHMKEDGKSSKAGQEVRLIEIPADAGKGHGAFEDLHGSETGAQFADALKEAYSSYYGSLSIAYLEKLVKEQDRVAKAIGTMCNTFLSKHLSKNCSGQVHRVAKRFALIAAAGELATEWCLTGWSSGEASDAAAICFNAWLDSREGAGQLEDTKIIHQVRLFFQQNLGAFADPTSTIPKSQNSKLFGYKERSSVDGPYEFFVFPESFKSEICKEYDRKLVTQVLTNAGILIRGTDSPSSHKRIQGLETKRYYHISTKVWGEDSSDPTTNDDSPEWIEEFELKE